MDVVSQVMEAILPPQLHDDLRFVDDIVFGLQSRDALQMLVAKAELLAMRPVPVVQRMMQMQLRGGAKARSKSPAPRRRATLRLAAAAITPEETSAGLLASAAGAPPVANFNNMSITRATIITIVLRMCVILAPFVNNYLAKTTESQNTFQALSSVLYRKAIDKGGVPETVDRTEVEYIRDVIQERFSSPAAYRDIDTAVNPTVLAALNSQLPATLVSKIITQVDNQPSINYAAVYEEWSKKEYKDADFKFVRGNSLEKNIKNPLKAARISDFYLQKGIDFIRAAVRLNAMKKLEEYLVPVELASLVPDLMKFLRAAFLFFEAQGFISAQGTMRLQDFSNVETVAGVLTVVEQSSRFVKLCIKSRPCFLDTFLNSAILGGVAYAATSESVAGLSAAALTLFAPRYLPYLASKVNALPKSLQISGTRAYVALQAATVAGTSFAVASQYTEIPILWWMVFVVLILTQAGGSYLSYRGSASTTEVQQLNPDELAGGFSVTAAIPSLKKLLAIAATVTSYLGQTGVMTTQDALAENLKNAELRLSTAEPIPNQSRFFETVPVEISLSGPELAPARNRYAQSIIYNLNPPTSSTLDVYKSLVCAKPSIGIQDYSTTVQEGDLRDFQNLCGSTFFKTQLELDVYRNELEKIMTAVYISIMKNEQVSVETTHEGRAAYYQIVEILSHPQQYRSIDVTTVLNNQDPEKLPNLVYAAQRRDLERVKVLVDTARLVNSQGSYAIGEAVKVLFAAYQPAAALGSVIQERYVDAEDLIVRYVSPSIDQAATRLLKPQLESIFAKIKYFLARFIVTLGIDYALTKVLMGFWLDVSKLLVFGFNTKNLSFLRTNTSMKRRMLLNLLFSAGVFVRIQGPLLNLVSTPTGLLTLNQISENLFFSIAFTQLALSIVKSIGIPGSRDLFVERDHIFLPRSITKDPEYQLMKEIVYAEDFASRKAEFQAVFNRIVERFLQNNPESAADTDDLLKRKVIIKYRTVYINLSTQLINLKFQDGRNWIDGADAALLKKAFSTIYNES